MPRLVSYVDDYKFGTDAYENATEDQHQITLFEAVRKDPEVKKYYDDFFSIPNGGSRHKAEAQILVMSGTKKGVSDTFLSVPMLGYHGLFIELKKLNRYEIKQNQIDFIKRKRETGYAAEICFGWYQAFMLIKYYLSLCSLDDLLATGFKFRIEEIDGFKLRR